MRMFISSLLIAVLGLSSVVGAVPHPGESTHAESRTNGERMARGLGPLRPRRLFSGSATLSARSAIPSGEPGTTVTGGVGLYTTGANGKRDNFLGYITINGFLSQGYEWFNQFSYALPSDSNALIRVMAPQYHNAAPWIFAPIVTGRLITGFTAGVANYYDYDVTTTSANIGLTGVQWDSAVDYRNVPAGSPAGYNNAAGSWTELTQWHIDPSTGIVTLAWKNRLAADPAITFCVVDGQLRGTADPALLSSQVAPKVVSHCGLALSFDVGGTSSH